MTKLGLLAITLGACASTAHTTSTPVAARTLTSAAPVHPAFFYQDAQGAPVGDATADTQTIKKIVPNAGAVLVTGTDKTTPITWGAFKRASGELSMTCTPGGTRIALDAKGLIPNGLYTAWAVFFEKPGFDPSFAHLTGLAPLGHGDGTDNTIVADATGSGTLGVTVPARDSVTFAIPGKPQAVPGCLLDSYEVHVVLAYHIDGKTHGGMPGTPDTVAEQLAWPIQNGAAPR